MAVRRLVLQRRFLDHRELILGLRWACEDDGDRQLRRGCGRWEMGHGGGGWVIISGRGEVDRRYSC
jgi:hypothetical protein